MASRRAFATWSGTPSSCPASSWRTGATTARPCSGFRPTSTPASRLPDELFEKICAARTYRAGSATLRQLYFAFTDMELHEHGLAELETCFDVQRRIAEKTTVLPPLPEDRFLCSFSHIFAGGYAAGYYSYKWAEVLSADAFSAFEEARLDDDAAVADAGPPLTGTPILALGGSRRAHRRVRRLPRPGAHAGRRCCGTRDWRDPKLSVNLNKVALLRNQRNIDIPSVTRMARIALDAGAHGITVHPRPDQRHIRESDVHALAELVDGEFNIEGNPFPDYLDIVRKVRPTQATLVPDSPGQSTSDHGWTLRSGGAPTPDAERLAGIVRELQGLGTRVSLFMDADPEQIAAVPEIGADRVELYTEPWARAFGTPEEDEVLAASRGAAEAPAPPVWV